MKTPTAPEWTTPEEAARAEGRYWLAQPIEARIAAMEEIRRRVYSHYGETPPRMDRVFRLVEVERS
jgi:hypothetical protein